MKNYKTTFSLVSILSLIMFVMISCNSTEDLSQPTTNDDATLEFEGAQSLEIIWNYIPQEDLTDNNLTYILNEIPNTDFEYVPKPDPSEIEPLDFSYSQLLRDVGVDEEDFKSKLEPLYNEEAVFLCMSVVAEDKDSLVNLVAFRPETFYQAALDQSERMSLDVRKLAQAISDQHKSGTESDFPTTSCGQGSCVGPMVGPEPEKDGPKVCPRIANPNSDLE